jgi:hypothetical protein
LSPAEITLVMKNFGGHVDSESFEKATKKMHGVDGRTVTDLGQLLNPGPELRPSRFKK